MGSIGNTGRMAAFQSDVFATGLDLTRGEMPRQLGTWRAADAATIRQGQVVSLNGDQEVVLPTNGANPLGFAKWNKLPGTGKALRLDEGISFAADTGTATLTRTSGVENVAIFSLAGRGGTQYEEGDVAGTDAAFFAATNGVVTRIANAINTGNEIPLATTVFASYSHDLVAADYDFQGRNFFNSNDDVTVAEGRMTVIQFPATLWTTEYVVNESWAENDAVYTVDEAGTGMEATDVGLVSKRVGGGTDAGTVFGTNGASAVQVGRCVQVPNADDAYLGIQLLSF